MTTSYPKIIQWLHPLAHKRYSGRFYEMWPWTKDREQIHISYYITISYPLGTWLGWACLPILLVISCRSWWFYLGLYAVGKFLSRIAFSMWTLLSVMPVYVWFNDEINGQPTLGFYMWVDVLGVTIVIERDCGPLMDCWVHILCIAVPRQSSFWVKSCILLFPPLFQCPRAYFILILISQHILALAFSLFVSF